MIFRRRAFTEVLDNLLTAITKGVAGESHPFPPPNGAKPPYKHSLQQSPVAEIVSVYGSRDGQSRLFVKEVDYALDSDQKTLVWKEGAQLPDPGTLFCVNYYPTSAQPVLTDIQTGSVVRTLAESIALEMARLYAQLEMVYRSGFVDSATGKALDNVVALLGMTRVRGGRPAGEVQFTRVAGSHGTITIPAGVRIITADGEVEYETTETITLAEGQNTARVVARDLEINDILPAGALTVLPVPIAGIESVTNLAPTAITTQDETDVELRTRAKNFLHGSERATLGALKQAIARQGITAEVEEMEETGKCRWVKITPQTESLSPELGQRLRTAIRDTRPAGVVVELGEEQPPRRVDLKLLLTTSSDLLEQDLRAAQRAVQKRIGDYFSRLPAQDPASINQIVGQVLSVPEIEDVEIRSATWTVDGATISVLDPASGKLTISGHPKLLGELQMIDPNLPTRLIVTVSYPEGETLAEAPSIQTALGETLTYLNAMNEDEGAEAARRDLSYGKLLYATPLPNKEAGSLEDYDDAPEATDLPDSTTVAPYQVQYTFIQESGLSMVLSGATDVYTLTVYERLSLSGAEVEAEAADG